MTLFSICNLQILMTALHVQKRVGVWFLMEQVSQNVNAILDLLGTCANVSILDLNSGDKINLSFQLKS